MMIGKVIEGRYAGSGVYKFPDNNVLVIQIPDGEKIALSKDNILSIENVTAHYSPTGNNTIMVMWNDFETSIIQFGLCTSSDIKPQETIKKAEIQTVQNKVTQSRKRNISPKLIMILCLLISLAMGGIFLANRHAKQIEEQTRIAEKQERNLAGLKDSVTSKMIDTISSTIDREYYGDLTKKQILNTLTVTYSNESIVGSDYSGVATYRITLGNRYYYYEISLVGNLDTGKGNASYIRDYDESSGSDTNYPSEISKSSTTTFTNKYGTATTRCAYNGCNKYIASSGDTNCCPTHSKKCLSCGCYIDSDAIFCMDCMFGN